MNLFSNNKDNEFQHKKHEQPETNNRQSWSSLCKSQRDREYVPGMSYRNIRDDFAVMPRLPESAFSRPTRWDIIDQEFALNLSRQEHHHHHPSFYDSDDDLSQSFDHQPQEDPTEEFILTEDVYVPMQNVRAKTPPAGYNGYANGMNRCKDCKSWYHLNRLTEGKCPECRPQVNHEVNNENVQNGRTHTN